MLAGPVVVVALVLATCAVVADRAAGERFFRHYAAGSAWATWPPRGPDCR